MKKFGLAMVCVVLMITLLTTGALAYMTASAENIGNSVTTGSMCLGTDPEPFMNISDLMPGGIPQEAAVTVFSGKPTKFFYKISASRMTGTSTKAWNALMVEVKDSVTGELWTGHLNSMETGWFARQAGVEGGGSGNGRLINFKTWLPQEADVDDETTATVKFEFDAEQWRPVS